MSSEKTSGRKTRQKLDFINLRLLIGVLIFLGGLVVFGFVDLIASGHDSSERLRSAGQVAAAIVLLVVLGRYLMRPIRKPDDA